MAIMPGFNYRMTELQAVVGKVQLGKLQTLLSLNKSRYDILYSSLSSKYALRQGVSHHDSPSWDTLILTHLTPSSLTMILECLHSHGIGTKNLPDAMYWHCSSFWHHALTQSSLDASSDVYSRLSTSVAIPILCSIPTDKYTAVAESL